MGDFPAQMIENIAGACVNTNTFPFSTAMQAELAVVNYAAAVSGQGNNGAVYVPFNLDQPKVLKQMFWENGAVAGTTDVGIYDANANRIVNLGATTNAGTLQIGNITDTLLTPGLYYAALLASTVVTQTYWSAAIQIPNLRFCGVQQQSVGGATLPNPATFAVPIGATLPLIGLCFQGTM
jgi:xanthine dehydrogenase iron-sulfur cluster and FAD-binding subunit A